MFIVQNKKSGIRNAEVYVYRTHYIIYKLCYNNTMTDNSGEIPAESPKMLIRIRVSGPDEAGLDEIGHQLARQGLITGWGFEEPQDGGGYQWNDGIHQGGKIYTLRIYLPVDTPEDRLEAITRFIEERHAWEVPEILRDQVNANDVLIEYVESGGKQAELRNKLRDQREKIRRQQRSIRTAIFALIGVVLTGGALGLVRYEQHRREEAVKTATDEQEQARLNELENIYGEVHRLERWSEEATRDLDHRIVTKQPLTIEEGEFSQYVKEVTDIRDRIRDLELQIRQLLEHEQEIMKKKGKPVRDPSSIRLEQNTPPPQPIRHDNRLRPPANVANRKRMHRHIVHRKQSR